MNNKYEYIATKAKKIHAPLQRQTRLTNTFHEAPECAQDSMVNENDPNYTQPRSP